MDTNDLWTKKMKEKLDSFSSDTPDKGWEVLEDDLKPDKPQWDNRLQRFTVIIAVLLIALSAVAAALIYIPDKDIPQHQEAVVEEAPADYETINGM